MDTKEAGHRGGSTTKRRYGHDFYVKIGKQGGAKAKLLAEAGRIALGVETNSSKRKKNGNY